jgi:hypothetical protein
VLTHRNGRRRRHRRIGGADASQNERQPAMTRLRTSPGALETWDWRSQCYCGSIQAKHYRRAWWCPICGREKDPARRPGC